MLLAIAFDDTMIQRRELHPPQTNEIPGILRKS
jgi:hypothetical protein